MVMLNPRRHPAIFAITTSVISGIVLVPFTGLLRGLPALAILTTSVPAWLALLITCPLAAMIIGIFRRPPPARAEIFLLMPAFSQKHWLAELLRNIDRSLDRRFDLVVKIPDSDYAGTAQIRRLRQTLTRDKGYIAGFVVAAEPDATREDLVTLCAKAPYPIIFVDVQPFAHDADYPTNTAFVGCSDELIGEKAGRYTARIIERSPAAHPTVLVIATNTHRGRQRRFVDVLTGTCPQATVIVDEDGLFARDRARDIVRRRLAELARQNRPVDVIFCTSDEMALGALDALYAPDAGDQARGVRVIGVDGTREALALINSGGSPLCATIVQDPARVAERAVDLMERKLRGDDTPKRNHLPVELYALD